MFLAVAGVALVGVAMMATADGPRSPVTDPSEPSSHPAAGQPSPEHPYRAFSASSWWNAPLPDDVPTNPDGAAILDYMRTARESGDGCLALAGAGNSHWGQPIYWTQPSDPAYDVRGVKNERPPELADLRIPEQAEPARNSDGTMSIYDLEKGYVVALTGARYNEDSDSWRARGATVTYLDSNGLHVDTGESDDRDNTGTHRGNNGATMAVSWDEVRAGAIRHVLKVALGPEVADRYVFPMVGSDGDYRGNDTDVPPQGLRFRIKPGVDLDALDLNPDALVIARALQTYGFYIGDSGGRTSLKLENTMAEGRGQLWNLTDDSLCSLPFSDEYWDVVAEGYDPAR